MTSFTDHIVWADHDVRLSLLRAINWHGGKSEGYTSDPAGLHVAMPKNESGMIELLHGAGFETDHAWMDCPTTGRKIKTFTVAEFKPMDAIQIMVGVHFRLRSYGTTHRCSHIHINDLQRVVVRTDDSVNPMFFKFTDKVFVMGSK